MRTGTVRLAEDGSIFYSLSGNEIVGMAVARVEVGRDRREITQSNVLTTSCIHTLS